MRRQLLPLVLLTFAVTACESALPSSPESSDEAPALTAAMDATGAGMLDALNVALEGQGADYLVASAEYYTDPSSDEMGNVIFARNVGNKKLSGDFVANDTRRSGTPNDIFYAVDAIDITGDVAPGADLAAINRAMSTWDAQTCSDLGMGGVNVAIDLGVVQNILGFGGNGGLFVDVMHSGFLPGAFFDLLAPGGSNFILGATFTFVWVSGGVLTDIDNNRRTDVAFRDIYYNDNFGWADDGVSDFDIETVALHEAGHGLSQAHFGKIFGTVANQTIHFAPRAVMNASYSGVQRVPTGTDNAGHCSNWGSWPSN